MYSMVQTDVAVDLMGWFAAGTGDRAVAASPVRVVDTRPSGPDGAPARRSPSA